MISSAAISKPGQFCSIHNASVHSAVYRLWCELWMAMAEYMVPEDLEIAIKSTYKPNKNRVTTNIGNSEVENGLPHNQVFANEA